MKNKLAYLFVIIFWLLVSSAFGQIKKAFKFSTFYIAANGGTSLSDRNVYSVLDELTTDVVKTPYDYSLTAGVRKIKRFQYEGNKQFKDRDWETMKCHH